MSARPVAYSQLVCDGCFLAYEHLGTPVADVRRRAARDGWKHRQVRYQDSNWNRQIDLCPECEEPSK